MTDGGESSAASAMSPRALIHRGRDRISHTFGVTQKTRDANVRGVLEGHQRSAIGYWLPLVLAVGIATMGLALGSTAVVIGAMLVSPLMSPIVETGMGLAIGSPSMVMNAGWRVLVSILVVIAAAAALTLVLPYQQLTNEIASRTSPTALDLLLAAFCGLAAAYTSVRDRSEIVATAAGTAIAIALVPPLCVTGWCVATARWHMAFGSLLLFVANLCAIIVATIFLFLLVAYDRVDVEAMERHYSSEYALLDRAATRLRAIFGTRYGSIARLLLPVLISGAVFIPLRTALSEVSWQVEVSAAITQMLDELPTEERPVTTNMRVERGTVVLKLVIVGESSTAAALQRRLEKKIAAISSLDDPHVEVVAVPDLAAVRRATANTPAASPIAVPRAPDVIDAHSRLDAELQQVWSSDSAGEILSWRLVVQNGSLTAKITHTGDALGATGKNSLARLLSTRLGSTVAIQDRVVSLNPVDAPADQGVRWLPLLVRAVEDTHQLEGLSLCITLPSPAAAFEGGDGGGGAAPDVPDPTREAVRTSVLREIAVLDEGRVDVVEGHAWRFVLSKQPCSDDGAAAEPAPPTAPAGSAPSP